MREYLSYGTYGSHSKHERHLGETFPEHLGIKYWWGKCWYEVWCHLSYMQSSFLQSWLSFSLFFLITYSSFPFPLLNMKRKKQTYVYNSHSLSSMAHSHSEKKTINKENRKIRERERNKMHGIKDRTDVWIADS